MVLLRVTRAVPRLGDPGRYVGEDDACRAAAPAVLAGRCRFPIAACTRLVGLIVAVSPGPHQGRSRSAAHYGWIKETQERLGGP